MDKGSARLQEAVWTPCGCGCGCGWDHSCGGGKWDVECGVVAAVAIGTRVLWSLGVSGCRIIPCVCSVGGYGLPGNETESVEVLVPGPVEWV